MGFAKEWHKLGPAWMQRERGRLFWGAIGQVLDELNAKMKEATLARFPDTAPDDALEHIGADRKLDQGPTETNDAFRARLKRAFELWVLGGSHKGMLLELKAQGFPMGTNGAHIVQHNGRYSYLDGSDNLVLGDTMACINRANLLGSIPGTLPGWTLDARDQFYSKFAVLFPVDVPALRPNTETAGRLNVAVRKWKPGKGIYVGAFVVETGGCLGWPLGQVLGDGGTLGTDVVHHIPPV